MSPSAPFGDDRYMTAQTQMLPAPAPDWRYTRLWARVPGNTLYLIAGFVLAMTAVGVLSSLFWSGIAMLVLVVGFPIVVLSLLVARGFGVADRYLLRLTGREPIAEPEWNRDGPRSDGFWTTLTRPVRNAHYWLYLLYGMIVSPIVASVSFGVTVLWWGMALGGLTFWIFPVFLPGLFSYGTVGAVVADAVPWLFADWSSTVVEIVLYLAAGLLFAATLPWVVAALARMHHAIARGMLGRWRSDDLADEVRAEAAARGAAVHAEDAALRRLERDIHDGPQQRLVRLQLDLAALERRAAAGDAEAAAELARESRGHVQAALDELRALSSGVAPPLLQDRGLVAALHAVAAASVVPVAAQLDPEIDGVTPEVARTAYFTVAELLTNVTKHSGATAVTLAASIRPAVAPEPAMLDVWVVDNGRGGARVAQGHGLDGLDERMRGLRGTLTVDSPQGGPTTIGAHIPLPPLS